MRLLPVIVSISSVLSLTGCFTGIESTPKITYDEVKRQKVEATPEQAFLSSVSGQPFGQWVSGKEFYVTDDKINIIFGATASSEDSLAGEIITYEHSNVVVSMTGDSIVELVFAHDGDREYVYRTGVTLSEMMSRRCIDVPFAIEKSMIEQVARKMCGNTYYVLTSIWYDENETVSYQRKYVPVTIVDASPGNHVYPVKLTFKNSSGDRYLMFMSMSENPKAPRGFASLFSFENPRLRYPDIDDDIWRNIINGKVVAGMTRDECRLSLGSPADISRRPGYNGVSELWLYDNGSYLMFQDGLLQESSKSVTGK